MKAVMASIHPKYCELIAAGYKSAEVRKNKPNLKPPFTCYIYQTKRTWIYKLLERLDYLGIAEALGIGRGKVVGEFVCDRINPIAILDGWLVDMNDCETSCLSAEEILKYSEGKRLYGWHISQLEIYERPMPIIDFHYACRKPAWSNCTLCKEAGENTCKQMTKPPQSWCYVEEL